MLNFRTNFQNNIKNVVNYRNFHLHPRTNIKPISMSYNLFTTTDQDSGATPLLIMHGLFGSKQNWRTMCKALQHRFIPNRKIISLDARNHGESPHSADHKYEHLAEDLSFFLQEHNIDRCCAMGHSMGGRAMMYFALKYPNLVDRAIIIDVSPIEMPRDFLQMGKIFLAMKNIQVPAGIKLPQARQLVEKQLKATVSDQETLDFVMQNLRQTSTGFKWTPNVTALHDNLKNIAHFPQETIRDKSYRGPTLFIGGSQSSFISPFQFDAIKELFPKAELEYIDSGHHIHLENPDDPKHWPSIQKLFPNSDLVWLDCGHVVHYQKPQEFMKIVVDFMNK